MLDQALSDDIFGQGFSHYVHSALLAPSCLISPSCRGRLQSHTPHQLQANARVSPAGTDGAAAAAAAAGSAAAAASSASAAAAGAGSAAAAAAAAGNAVSPESKAVHAAESDYPSSSQMAEQRVLVRGS